MRTSRHRDEAGFTLIELMITMAISAVILLPLTSWIFVQIRNQDAAKQQNSDALSSGLLTSYLQQDLAQADATPGAVLPAGTDCGPGAGAVAGPSDAVLVVISSGGATGSRLAYTAVRDPLAGTFALWRRVCPASGGLTGETRVGRGFRGVPTVSCASRTGVTIPTDADVCGQLEITVPGARKGALVVGASRRAGGPR